MIRPEDILPLLGSLVWLLAGVGIFIVGMNFLSSALEKSAGSGLKKLLGKITNNRFSGVGIGAGVTALIQSSSATSVMVIGLVNAGVLTLLQATSVIMGANVGTTVTGLLVSLKNDYFNMVMYLFAFVGVMMGFFKKEKVKLLGTLFSGLGLVFVGLNIMSSKEAFGSELIHNTFTSIFDAIDFPLLLILVGAIFTALIQSSSAATGVVITMVGTGILNLDSALFIILGANIGTCLTALLASLGANENAKRVAFIHFAFNVLGTVLFTIFIWIFKNQAVDFLVMCFPKDDPMSLQMRVSLFHVIFNVSTTLVLLPFVKQLVKLSTIVIRDKKTVEEKMSFKFVDERLLTTPIIALSQVKKEIAYMIDLVNSNIASSFDAILTGSTKHTESILENEKIINFTNNELTKYLIKLTAVVDTKKDEQTIGSYFHVLNDLERIGDHAENFNEISLDLNKNNLAFSETATTDIKLMEDKISEMLIIVKDVFLSKNKKNLKKLSKLEDEVDQMKKQLTEKHFGRLADGLCSIELSPYYNSAIMGLERVADHLVNVGFSIVNPVGEEQ